MESEEERNGMKNFLNWFTKNFFNEKLINDDLRKKNTKVNDRKKHQTKQMLKTGEPHKHRNYLLYIWKDMKQKINHTICTGFFKIFTLELIELLRVSRFLKLHFTPS